jgi:hypothetical protein
MALQNITQIDFLKALKKNRFNVTKACEIVGISRQSHYNWLDTDIEYLIEYDNLRESITDLAEESLIELIQGAYKEVIDKDGNVRLLKDVPDSASVRYYLDRLGKKRGYKIEQVIDNQTTIKVVRE